MGVWPSPAGQTPRNVLVGARVSPTALFAQTQAFPGRNTQRSRNTRSWCMRQPTRQYCRSSRPTSGYKKSGRQGCGKIIDRLRDECRIWSSSHAGRPTPPFRAKEESHARVQAAPTSSSSRVFPFIDQKLTASKRPAHLGRRCRLPPSWTTSFECTASSSVKSLASMSSRTLSSRVFPTRTSSIGSTWNDIEHDRYPAGAEGRDNERPCALSPPYYNVR